MPITRMAFLAAMVLSMVAGAGCANPTATEPTVPSVPTNPSAEAPKKIPAPETSPTAASIATTTVGLPPIDGTWRTYTNNALKFSFQWPPRGRYAPSYEVTFANLDDARIKDGCLTDQRNVEQPPTNDLLNNSSFCHSSYGEGTAGTYHLFDYYLTKKDTRFIVITFRKDYVTQSNNFDVATYRATLDQIVGTFTYSE